MLIDERDQLIQQRSWILAYAVFWVVFVLAAVAALCRWFTGRRAQYPCGSFNPASSAVSCSCIALASIAILVQYAGGSKDAG